MALKFGLLGPLEIKDTEGRPVIVRGARRRRLLLRLLVSANCPVGFASLLEDVWEGQASPGAMGTLQSHVSLLRRIVGAQLVTQPTGYLLAVGDEDLDARVYEREVRNAGDQLTRGDARGAVTTLRGALARWRGAALADAAGALWTLPESARLEELRLSGTEMLVKALLAVGDSDEAVSLAERSVGEYPLREQLWAHLMFGLADRGRQTEALRAFQRLRSHLAEGVGLDPSPYLASLENAILTQRPAAELRSIWRAGVGLPAPVRVAAVPEPDGGRRQDQPERSEAPAAVPAPGGSPSQPVATAGGSAAPAGPAPARPTFVGREAELATVERIARSVAADHTGRVVVITGEPGMGRSSFVREASERIRELGFELGTNWANPRLPAHFARLVDRLSSHDELAVVASAQLQELRDRRRRGGAGAPPAGDRRTRSDDPLFATIASSLSQIAWQRPLFLPVGDAHLAAPDDVRVLWHILAPLKQVPILFMLTLRDTHVAPDHPLWPALRALRADPSTTFIELQGLDDAELLQLVESTTRRRDRWSRRLAHQLGEETGGNPLLATASLRRHLQGDLTQSLPVVVTDLVDDWVKPIGPRARHALNVLAVMGDSVELSLLKTVTGGRTNEVLDALDELERLRLIVDEGAGRFRIRLPAVATALVENMSRSRRTLLAEKLRSVGCAGPAVGSTVGSALGAAVAASPAGLAS